MFKNVSSLFQGLKVQTKKGRIHTEYALLFFFNTNILLLAGFWKDNASLPLSNEESVSGPPAQRHDCSASPLLAISSDWCFRPLQSFLRDMTLILPTNQTIERLPVCSGDASASTSSSFTSVYFIHSIPVPVRDVMVVLSALVHLLTSAHRSQFY